MGTLRFGKDEQTTCIVDVSLEIEGQPLCVAYKTTTYWVGGGIYLSNDGYVLKPRERGGVYYELTPDMRDGKVEGIPHPLPHYAIPTADYAWGYSLWWVIALAIAWGVFLRWMRRRRQKSFEALQQTAPLDFGPPRLDTDGDRLVNEMVRPLLVSGESIQHQAYALSWDFNGERSGDEAFFVILTTDRLFLITTRIGGFGILFENNRVDAIPRSDIAAASVDHGTVLFITAMGVQRGYIVKKTKVLSNQQAFLHNVARILARGQEG
jgi:hypothetical protein